MQAMNADAAAGAVTALALLKRKENSEAGTGPDLKKMKIDAPSQTPGLPPTTTFPSTTVPPTTSTVSVATSTEAATSQRMTPAYLTKVTSPKARAIRLEQNRKAAQESRRRKKVMIEELQRSVIFFSRANSTLKQQNDELTRLLIQAQGRVASIEGGEKPVQTPSPVAVTPATEKTDGEKNQQAEAQAVAAQALYESQGFPAAAARAAAHTMNATVTAALKGTPPSPAPAAPVPSMQPGATMQAMANFQQAAAVAMQAAMQGMQSIPGVNMNQLAATPVGANAQQAYTDTMTALAMQQAAAAAGQQLAQSAFPFMAQAVAWQQAQQAQATNQESPKKD